MILFEFYCYFLKKSLNLTQQFLKKKKKSTQPTPKNKKKKRNPALLTFKVSRGISFSLIFSASNQQPSGSSSVSLLFVKFSLFDFGLLISVCVCVFFC